MNTQSQRTWVHTQLIAGRKLTPLDALDGCGCLRLGARIHDLRKLGYQIKSELVEKNGKRVAQYSKG